MQDFPFTTEYNNGMIRELPNRTFVALSDYQHGNTLHKSREDAIAWLQLQEDLALSDRV